MEIEALEGVCVCEALDQLTSSQVLAQYIFLLCFQF